MQQRGGLGRLEFPWTLIKQRSRSLNIQMSDKDLTTELRRSRVEIDAASGRRASTVAKYSKRMTRVVVDTATVHLSARSFVWILLIRR